MSIYTFTHDINLIGNCIEIEEGKQHAAFPAVLAKDRGSKDKEIHGKGPCLQGTQ